MEVLPELEPPFKTITGFTRSTIAGRCKEALHRSGRTELALNKSHIELPPVSGGWGRSAVVSAAGCLWSGRAVIAVRLMGAR